MRPTNLIVIHCADSPNGDTLYRGTPGHADFRNPAQTIDEWHAVRGFHRAEDFRRLQNPELRAIGYHFVICRSGLVLTGRHVDEIGAHVQGWNQKSIGICLVGTDEFTAEQWASLAHLVTAETARISNRNGPADRNNPLSIAACPGWAREHGITITGHRDLPNVHKLCPCFDVATWLGNGMAQGHPVEAPK